MRVLTLTLRILVLEKTTAIFGKRTSLTWLYSSTSQRRGTCWRARSCTSACSASSAEYKSGVTPSLNVDGEVFATKSSMWSRSMSWFCGGSWTEKSGCRRGKTLVVNSMLERFLQMWKTFGRMKGRSVRSGMSSRRAGRTLRRKRRSEN